ncbi:MAG: hypothetical protein M1833_007035 [Piccolia ochrophora]|nr:MAG: hypothetical protein M1833_007035 [Piccolia ochrophora]
MAATTDTVATNRGTVSYVPNWLNTSSDPADPFSPRFFRSRPRRGQRINIVKYQDESRDYYSTPPKKYPQVSKLAVSREGAKRFLRSVVSSSNSHDTSSTLASANLSTSATRTGAESTQALEDASMTQPECSTQTASRPSIGGPVSGMVSRPSLIENVSRASGRLSISNDASDVMPTVSPEEKPVASGNGIHVFITLAEPLLYLQGFDQNDSSSRATAMLRGSLVIKVTKTAKLKAVNLSFRGKARTEWPEGIPPRKTDFFEEETINRHTWTFFNAQFPAAENGYCADYVKLAKDSGSVTSTLSVPSSGRLAFDQFAKSATPLLTTQAVKDQKRLSLQLNRSRSFGKGDSAPNGQTTAQKGYKTFHPGHYLYNFELPLDSHLPETINVELGSVKYELEASIERSGTFRANLLGSKEVKLIRAPSESSLEQVEPIAISRTWEDQLHYDIVISGKSFPLGAQVPIAFKLTPLAKVQCHRIKVFVTENIEYYCSKKRVHRLEPTRKVQLFEKRADAPSLSTFPGSSLRILSGGGVDFDHREAAAHGNERVRRDRTSLLGNLEGEHNIGPTEMECNVQLPSCHNMRERDKMQQLHFDTTFANIQVHHWIKIVMRLSKPDDNDPSKRRHFEISIDSPFNILSCQATQANTSLPAYSTPSNNTDRATDGNAYECGCPGAPRRNLSHPPLDNIPSQLQANGRQSSNSSPAPPPAAHVEGHRQGVQRPIHILRNPSFNPPAFDDEEPPPPMLTPPPQYDSIVGEGEGLADYFARLADEEADEEDGEGDENSSRGLRSRVNLPLTPGGRVNRSMDERRTWLAPGHLVG